MWVIFIYFSFFLTYMSNFVTLKRKVSTNHINVTFI